MPKRPNLPDPHHQDVTITLVGPAARASLAADAADHVLQLHAELDAAERTLALEEAHRQGFGTEHSGASLCITVARDARDVDLDDARRAVDLLLAIRPQAAMRHVSIPRPYCGMHCELFQGTVQEFAEGLAS